MNGQLPPNGSQAYHGFRDKSPSIDKESPQPALLVVPAVNAATWGLDRVVLFSGGCSKMVKSLAQPRRHMPPVPLISFFRGQNAHPECTRREGNVTFRLPRQPHMTITFRRNLIAAVLLYKLIILSPICFATVPLFWSFRQINVSISRFVLVQSENRSRQSGSGGHEQTRERSATDRTSQLFGPICSLGRRFEGKLVEPFESWPLRLRLRSRPAVAHRRGYP